MDTKTDKKYKKKAEYKTIRTLFISFIALAIIGSILVSHSISSDDDTGKIISISLSIVAIGFAIAIFIIQNEEQKSMKEIIDDLEKISNKNKKNIDNITNVLAAIQEGVILNVGELKSLSDHLLKDIKSDSSEVHNND